MKQRSTSDQVIKSGHFPPQGSSHHCHKRMYKGARYLSLGRSSSLPFYITTHSRQSCCEGVDSKSLFLYPVLEHTTSNSSALITMPCIPWQNIKDLLSPLHLDVLSTSFTGPRLIRSCHMINTM